MGYVAVDGIVETVENASSILTSFPNGLIPPQPFIDGSRQNLENVEEAVRHRLGLSFPGAVLAWQEFLRQAPQSDDVHQYIVDHPLYIPFKEELFGITPEDNSDR